MSRVQLAVFPAILISIIFIFVATNFIAKPQIVLAANNNQSEQETQTSLHSLQSPDHAAILAQNSIQPEVFQGSGSYSDSPSNPEIYNQGQQTQSGPSSQVPSVKPIFITSDSQLEPDCSLSAQYPDLIRRWCNLIEKYARENNLEPGLVAALITQESGGDSNAYSSSGAVGLMQVMPRDGLAASFECASGPCFSSRPDIRQLQDPEFNIAYGTRMLSSLFQKYGSIREALKNYGPIDVDYGYADLVLNIFNSRR